MRRVGAAAGKALSDQRIRFLFVGGFNTALGPAAFAALYFTVGHTVGYITVLTAAWIIAVFVAFLGYRYLVFRVRGTFLRDLARFSLVYVGLYLVNLAALPLLVQVARLPVLLAQAITFPVIVLLSYVGNSRFSFRRTDTQAE